MRALAILKIVLRWVMGLFSAAVTGVLIALLVLTAMISSDGGRVAMAEFGSRVLAEHYDIHIRWKNAHSYHIDHWAFDRLTAHHGEEELADLSKFELRFNAWQLYRKLHIQTLTADNITLNLHGLQNLPPMGSDAPEENSEDEEESSFDITAYPMKLDKLAIKRFALPHKNLEAGWAEYQIRGNAALFTEDAPFEVNASISTLSGTPLTATIITKASGPKGPWKFVADLHEAEGGVLAAWLQQPANKPLKASFNTTLAYEAEQQSWHLVPFRLETELNDKPITARGEHHLIGKQLSVKDVHFQYGEAELNTSGTIDFEAMIADFELKLKQFDLALLRPFGLALPVGLEAVLSADATVKGALEAPEFKLTANGTGKILRSPYQLAVQAEGTPQKITIEKASITSEKGALDVSGTASQEALDFALTAKALSSDLLHLFSVYLAPSTLSAKLALKGTASSPEISGTTSLTSDDLKLNVKLATKQGVLSSEFDFYKESKPLGDARLTVPLQTYLQHDSTQPLPLDFKLSMHSQLPYLSLVLDPAIHKLSGKVSAELTGSGTVDHPLLNGKIALTNGAYENRLIGCNLNQISLILTANESSVKVKEFKAIDTGGGTMNLAGGVSWPQSLLGDDSEVGFTLNLKNTKLIERHDIEGSASGKIELTGSLRELLLSGDIDISPLKIWLNHMSAQAVPSLEVEEIYDFKDRKTDSPPMTQLTMDINVAIGKDSLIQGLGLNTGMEGNIKISGVVPDIDFDGKFKTVKGHYNLLGREFSLNEGRIDFDNNRVLLFVPASYQSKGGLIEAQLSGELEELEVNLSSIPPMPQEEIISWLLFGKNSDSISPFQAIRLANAVQEMRSGKSLFDPIDSVRKALDLDTITIESDESGDENDVSVGVGKYLNEKVYLEVEKGSNPAQPIKGKVEFELRDNLKLETQTGGDAGVGGVELKWKKDY